MIIKKKQMIQFVLILYFAIEEEKQNSTIWKYNYTLIQLCHLK